MNVTSGEKDEGEQTCATQDGRCSAKRSAVHWKRFRFETVGAKACIARRMSFIPLRNTVADRTCCDLEHLTRRLRWCHLLPECRYQSITKASMAMA